MKAGWTRAAEVLHAQLLAEARAARPGTGARRATEKAEYCRALHVLAARVREWLLGEERTIEGLVRLMARTEMDLVAATAAALVERSAKRRGWSCGLYRALSLAVEVFDAAAVRVDVRTAVKMTAAMVNGMVAFEVETSDPEAQAAEAERVFFEEADRVLGQGGE